MTLTHTANWDHGQRRQTLVGQLLRDIFQGKLRAGQHLITRELSERFGVSHTPIREALIALEGMGVVDLLPNRGAAVRRVRARDIEEICHVRRLLECEAVRNACGRLGVAELTSLEAEFSALAAADPDDPRFVEQARATDNRLHDLLASRCGNAFLGAELTRLKLLFRACRDVSWEHHDARNASLRVAEEAREHLAIVSALRAEKPAGAAAAMARHIDAGCVYWSRAVAESLEADVGAPLTKKVRTVKAPLATAGNGVPFSTLPVSDPVLNAPVP